MKIVVFAILVVASLASLPALAETIICKTKPEGSLNGMSEVRWDSKNGTARFTFPEGATTSGKVSLTREFDESGNSVNLTFPRTPENFLSGEQLELYAVPLSRNRYRIIGMEFDVIKGVKFMSADGGTYTATCTKGKPTAKTIEKATYMPSCVKTTAKAIGAGPQTQSIAYAACNCAFSRIAAFANKWPSAYKEKEAEIVDKANTLCFEDGQKNMPAFLSKWK